MQRNKAKFYGAFLVLYKQNVTSSSALWLRYLTK